MEEQGAFAYSLTDLPAYEGPLGPATIELKDPSKVMWMPQRQYTDEEYAVGDGKLAEMMSASIVEEVPTTTPHSAAVSLPMKRLPDGSWGDLRWCWDGRLVNSNSVVDTYSMPLPEELFRRMRGARYLTKLDMKSGFFGIKLNDPHMAACFTWRSKRYHFLRLPFGYVNSTAIYQRRMELELAASGVGDHCTVFVDNVCIYSDTMEEHIQHVQTLLRHFSKVGLRAHPAKTIVAADAIPYLGHIISASDLRPDPAKVAAMQSLQPPTSVKRLQAHVGLFNYYRCYIPEFSRVARPLYELLRKGAAFVWGTEQQAAYDSIKTALSTPGLALKQPDRDQPFKLYTDWSTYGIAAVLNQVDQQGNERLVACVSRSLNEAERNYPAWKGEMLAAVYGIKAFRSYLLTRRFQLITDHCSLLWLLTHKNPVGQQARWVLSVSEYQFDLVHKAGSSNPADVPSREPVACAADWTGSRLDTAADALPLPKVYLADGTPDPQSYSHDELAQQLCIPSGQAARGAGSTAASASSTSSTAGAAQAADSYAAVPDRPSLALAQLAGDSAVTYSQAECFALHAMMAIAAECSLCEHYDCCTDTWLGGGETQAAL